MDFIHNVVDSSFVFFLHQSELLTSNVSRNFIIFLTIWSGELAELWIVKMRCDVFSSKIVVRFNYEW